MRKWSQQDLNQIKNILVALNKAEYKVQGQEILAFGQAVRWISMLHEEVSASLKPSPPINLSEKKEQPKSKKKK